MWDHTYIVCCLHSGDYQKDSFKNKYRSLQCRMDIFTSIEKNAPNKYLKKCGIHKWCRTFMYLTTTCIYNFKQSILWANKNRPFPSSPSSLYQNEAKCSTFDLEMTFCSHANTTQERLCTWPRFESEDFQNLEEAYQN